MTKKVTFGDVHRLLKAFGFVLTPVEGSHVLFEHKASETLLPFRAHRLSERVDPVTLAIVRSVLDGRGFLDRDDFDNALQKVIANGRAKSGRKQPKPGNAKLPANASAPSAKKKRGARRTLQK